MRHSRRRHNCHSPKALRHVTALVGLVALGAQSVYGHVACPTPPGFPENPLSTPAITAGEVAANPTPANAARLALAARDYMLSLGPNDQLGLAHASCLMRQEGGDWRSGGIFPVALSINPELAVNPQAPVNMRVTFHATDMALSGRLVSAETAGTILAAATSDQANGGTVPDTGGHAVLYGPFIMLVGVDVRESHLDPHVIDAHYMPQVTASEVRDRTTLKIFVDEAIHYMTQLFGTYGYEAIQIARGALRDPNGPWISGPTYILVFDPAGYTLFHGAFPDRYEYVPTGTARDSVTGELILTHLLNAANEGEEGGFARYHFDNPDDDSDSLEIPKVTYVRQVEATVPHPLFGQTAATFIVAAGIYGDPGSGTSAPLTGNCADRNIAASEVKTLEGTQSFVECAAAYLAEHGPAEARRAFNEDPRWKHGATYVFVDGIAESGVDSRTFVYPPDPSREGRFWGEAIDDFGTDLFYEIYRMTSVVDSGWVYYSFPNPATGRNVPKASYVIEVDWNGYPAVIGTGLYARDWPGTCNSDEVSADVLTADPNPETLREFVRCAAAMVESEGYVAKQELEGDPRWADGTNYAYVLDTMGNQVISGNRFRVNGNALHEWRSGAPRTDQFGGRDMVDVGHSFGESYIYYLAHNPRTGGVEPKIGFLKRVVAHGVPLLVGAGYFVDSGQPDSGSSCAENYVSAAAIRTQGDIQAFVRCAAEYASVHGEEEARRAFHEDERWRHGPYYVFVDLIAQPEEAPLSHIAVFPPNPDWEGTSQVLVDNFGTDYFDELHRIMSLVDAGWIHYAFTNFETRRSEPKRSYVIEVDWDGHRAVVGAGIYERDLPGNCASAEVNAAGLEASPDDHALREFVNCAATVIESSGYFAGPLLSRDSRWKHGSIYIFGIDVETGVIEFSGSDASFSTSGRIPELLFDGRDMIEAASIFGEAFWYYNFENPTTGRVEPKVAFVKVVRAQGIPLLVGSGYGPRGR